MRLHKLGIFTEEEEAFIQKEVERLLFEPELPNAGDKEREIIKRLKKMSYTAYWKNSEAAASWMVDDEKKKTIGWLCAKAVAAAERLGGRIASQSQKPGLVLCPASVDLADEQSGICLVY